MSAQESKTKSRWAQVYQRSRSSRPWGSNVGWGYEIADTGFGAAWKCNTKSNCGPVSGLCGNLLHFSTVFHSLAIMSRASAPSLTLLLWINQHPITIPVRPIPPRQCTTVIRFRLSLSLKTPITEWMNSMDWGRHRSWMGKRWYSISWWSMPWSLAREVRTWPK